MNAPVLTPAYDVAAIRKDFPILAQQVYGKPLVYLDNAASSQTPRPVIDALVGYYENDRSNVHRGIHELSQRVVEQQARQEELSSELARLARENSELRSGLGT